MRPIRSTRSTRATSTVNFRPRQQFHRPSQEVRWPEVRRPDVKWPDVRWPEIRSKTVPDWWRRFSILQTELSLPGPSLRPGIGRQCTNRRRLISGNSNVDSKSSKTFFIKLNLKQSTVDIRTADIQTPDFYYCSIRSTDFFYAFMDFGISLLDNSVPLYPLNK